MIYDDDRHDLEVRLEEGVAWVVFNRPEVKNALLIDQRVHLARLFDRFSDDHAVRAVVVTGRGDYFSSGADLVRLGDVRARPAGAPERIVGDGTRRVRQGAHVLISAILDCEKPVIAAVNGSVAGMSVQVALACDLVLASEEARFIEIFVRRGLVPDSGAAYLLARLIGPQKAKEVLFFGDALSAERALELGLVNAIVPGDQLTATAETWARRLAAGPTRAIALSKWLVNRSLDADREGAFGDEAIAVELNGSSRDAQEGLRAFAERRQAAFLGW